MRNFINDLEHTRYALIISKNPRAGFEPLTSQSFSLN